MNKYIILWLAATISYCAALDAETKFFACYVLSWSVYRPDEGKFSIEDIEPDLCTHIIYSYNQINQSNWSIQPGDNWADFGVGNIKQLVELKEDNPDLKIMISIGGWTEASERFTEMVAEEERRQTFIDSVVEHFKKYNLDGLDIDWEYPTLRGGRPKDRDNFSTLLQEIRKRFDKENYILSVRLQGKRFAADPGYDLPKISDAVDFINLFSYEYHGNWELLTSIFAPLRSSDENNVEFSVNYYLDKGVDSEKLLLGLSPRGNAFFMDNRPSNGMYLGQLAKESFKGPWLAQDGALAYNEICWNFKKSRTWLKLWDSASETPYAVHGRKFTSYENKKSFEKKLELVKSKQLGGVSLYSLDMDDFSALCHEKPFYLTNVVRSYLFNEPYISDADEIDQNIYQKNDNNNVDSSELSEKGSQYGSNIIVLTQTSVLNQVFNRIAL